MDMLHTRVNERIRPVKRGHFKRKGERPPTIGKIGGLPPGSLTVRP